MKVVLIQKVENLGNPGDVREVKPGYARNFLFLKKLAVLPGAPKAIEISKDREKDKLVAKSKSDDMAKFAAKIDGQKFSFQVKADKSGKLYGSIGPKDISDFTNIPEKNLRTHYKKIGLYELPLNLDNHKIMIKIDIKKK